MESLVTSPAFNKLRFVVGSYNGPYSARWSIWAHKGNVYILSSPIGHAIKLSLHGEKGSLVCQLAHTSHYYAKNIAHHPDAAGRDVVRWKRKPTPPDGFLHVASIVFPADYMRLPPARGTPKKPLIIFAASGPGTKVEIGVFYSRIPPPQAAVQLVKEGTVVGHIVLPDGEFVYVVRNKIDQYEPPQLPTGERLLPGQDFRLTTGHWTPEQKAEILRASGENTLAMITFNHPTDGEPLTIFEFGGLKFRLPEASALA